jgi:hypothetical protein
MPSNFLYGAAILQMSNGIGVWDDHLRTNKLKNCDAVDGQVLCGQKFRNSSYQVIYQHEGW